MKKSTANCSEYNKFNGFSKEAIDFLFNIRVNNNKEWFEPHKKIYTEQLYAPLKDLTELIFKPFEHTGMICKTGRIYRDESFPPYLHYRDTLWIYVRYQSYNWNKTPTLYFEISPEGVEFGFRIAKPEAAVMESFRSQLTEDPKPFLELTTELKSKGIIFGGDEYKRKKKCTVPEAEEFFIKKGLSAYEKITDISVISSAKLADSIISCFKNVMPLNEMFHKFAVSAELAKALEKENAAAEESAPEIVKAPQQDFMW